MVSNAKALWRQAEYDQTQRDQNELATHQDPEVHWLFLTAHEARPSAQGNRCATTEAAKLISPDCSTAYQLK